MKTATKDDGRWSVVIPFDGAALDRGLQSAEDWPWP